MKITVTKHAPDAQSGDSTSRYAVTFRDGAFKYVLLLELNEPFQTKYLAFKDATT